MQVSYQFGIEQPGLTTSADTCPAASLTVIDSSSRKRGLLVILDQPPKFLITPMLRETACRTSEEPCLTSSFTMAVGEQPGLMHISAGIPWFPPGTSATWWPLGEQQAQSVDKATST
ncbi:Hypothetical predicted protein [Podarcis lilfordi]|uniref:Uncharacterized protein n=1 Tax=Podarcis lilfordi TaxID=74358 RepID=A0AA35NVN3_9SAUR|nr:Hypothetical predicted protein [Podarcis lilfordi]